MTIAARDFARGDEDRMTSAHGTLLSLGETDQHSSGALRRENAKLRLNSCKRMAV
jgi:hypothetical protein